MQEKNVFEQEITILSYLIDEKKELAPQYLLLLMQEIAWEHVDKNDVGWDYLYRFNQFWALTRMHVKVFRMPNWKEVVTLKTWGKLSEGVSHYRDHEMVDQAGNVMIAATSTWVILDFITGRPQKADTLPTHLYVNEQKHAIKESTPKIQNIVFPEEERIYHSVLYSDIDVNRHVNNSKYLQFAIDALPFDYVQEHHLKEFFLNFTRQAKRGDRYAVQYKEIENDNFISNVYVEEGGKELAKVQTIWEAL